MTQDRLNMTGLWHGTYVYPDFAGPTTPFVANFSDTDGHLSGSIMEPNLVGVMSEELEAIVAGNREGRAVDFIKTYDGKSDASNSVDYVGRLSGDGNRLTGVWSYEAWDGTFEMHRDAALEELVTAEEQAEFPQELQPAVTPDVLS